MMNRKVAIFLLACIVVSCSNMMQNEVTPSLSLVVTDTSLPTNTPLEETTPLPLSTPRPTRTVQPTKTVDPFLATREAALGSCRGNPSHSIEKYIGIGYSSNGQWISTICQDNGIYTKVSNLALGVVWNVPALDDDQNNEGPEWYWVPYLWSSNGKYLYLIPECICSIDSPWLIYASGFGLSRLDLNSGLFDVWLSPSFNPWYNFSFSADANLFAYTPPDFYQVIKIRDLITSEERNISFKGEYNILKYQWTPDNSRLVIFTEEQVDDPLESAFSVFVYSLKNDTLIKITEKRKVDISVSTDPHDEPRISISNLTNDVLELSNIYSEEKFQINLRSGEFISISEDATPTPTP